MVKAYNWVGSSRKRGKVNLVCGTCEKPFILECFTYTPGRNRYCSNVCQSKAKQEYMKSYFLNNKHKRPKKTVQEKEQLRWNRLEKIWGLSKTDYEALLESQEGKCAICGEKESTKNQYGIKNLAVDHCLFLIMCEDCCAQVVIMGWVDLETLLKYCDPRPLT